MCIPYKLGKLDETRCSKEILRVRILELSQFIKYLSKPERLEGVSQVVDINYMYSPHVFRFNYM